jgi:hypothetical protein
MYYLDNDLSLNEANETTVYRVFGGESSLEGGYVTPELPQNPIQARCDLALSQCDFDSRNLASHVATGTIYTDDAGEIINLETLRPTEDALEFTMVEPTSDMPGGGLEYHLESPFEDIVEVDHIDELRHQPTEGWSSYVEAEEKMLADLSEPDTDWGQDASNNDNLDADSTSPSSVETLIEDELYDIQKSDTDSLYDDVDWTANDDDGREDRGLDDEWYNDSDHVEDALDDLIDDEIYEAEATDADESWCDAVNTYLDEEYSSNEMNENDRFR